MSIIIENAEDAISNFGEPLVAKRKTKVRIREVNGVETFESKYGKGTLIAKQGIDYVVIPDDGSDPYPCKIDIFHETWEEIDGEGTYRKTGLCRFIPIPEYDSPVTLKTLEGDVTVSYPNYIAIGAKGEVYSYSKEWINKNLDLIYVVINKENREVISVYSTLELAENCKRVNPNFSILYHSLDCLEPPDFLCWAIDIKTSNGNIISSVQLNSFDYKYSEEFLEDPSFNLSRYEYKCVVRSENKEDAEQIAIKKFEEALKNASKAVIENLKSEK